MGDDGDGSLSRVVSPTPTTDEKRKTTIFSYCRSTYKISVEWKRNGSAAAWCLKQASELSC